MGSPSQQDLRFLREWMNDTSMGNVFLLSIDHDLWETCDIRDTVALRPRPSDNLFARISNRFLVRWFHRVIGHFFKVCIYKLLPEF